MKLQLKRIYDDPSSDDGCRVLVDRLWPRGVSKERAAVDEWLKEIAPSPDLREWFGHKPDRFEQFSERYEEELDHNPALKKLSDILSARGRITLLYAAKDTQINHAAVLLDYIEKRFLIR